MSGRLRAGRRHPDIPLVTTKRTLAIPGLVIALALALAGCGGQPFPESEGATPAGSDASPPATLQARLLAAIKHTNGAKTARMAIDMTMSGFGAEMGTVKVSGTGEMDLAHRRLAMKLHGGVTGQDADVEMRLIDGTAYFKTNDRWVRTTATSVGSATPLPSNYLDYLQGISGAVRIDGHEKLRGVATTRYTAAVDLNRALARVGSETQRDALDTALKQFGLATMPVTVWIDDAGRLRKMKLTMDLGAFGGQSGASAGFEPKVEIALELYDFGVPVSIDAPRAAEKSGTAFCIEEVCDDLGAPTTAHGIQADLRNALTAEKVVYTDGQTYTADVASLQDIESKLDWGGRLKIVVGDSSVGPSAVLCLSETSNGMTYSIGDIASGPRAGTYYHATPCPKKVNETSFAGFDSSW